MTSPTTVIPVPLDDVATAHACFSWEYRRNEQQADVYVAKLSPAALLDIADAADRLRQRAMGRYVALAAEAALSPDSLPSGVDGYPISGVHTRRTG